MCIRDRFPDADRYWLSFGANYRVTRDTSLDFAYSYVQFSSGKMDYRDGCSPAGWVPGAGGLYQDSGVPVSYTHLDVYKRQRIAYVSFEQRRPRIFVQHIDTGRREQITNFEGLNGAPAWSPDGNRLAFVLSRDGNPEIYVMDMGLSLIHI